MNNIILYRFTRNVLVCGNLCKKTQDPQHAQVKEYETRENLVEIQKYKYRRWTVLMGKSLHLVRKSIKMVTVVKT